jgi:hypothetical protein
MRPEIAEADSQGSKHFQERSVVLQIPPGKCFRKSVPSGNRFGSPSDKQPGAAFLQIEQVCFRFESTSETGELAR